MTRSSKFVAEQLIVSQPQVSRSAVHINVVKSALTHSASDRRSIRPAVFFSRIVCKEGMKFYVHDNAGGFTLHLAPSF